MLPPTWARNRHELLLLLSSCIILKLGQNEKEKQRRQKQNKKHEPKESKWNLIEIVKIEFQKTFGKGFLKNKKKQKERNGKQTNKQISFYFNFRGN